MTEKKNITGLASLLHAITAIQTKIDDFVTEDGEVIEIKNTGEFVRRKKVEYLGIDVPPEALVINAKGRIAMAKPRCPQCNSLEIRENGTRKRKPATIIGDIIELKIQKYQCANCKKNFEPSLANFISRYQRITREIQEFGVLLYEEVNSGEEVAGILKEMFNVEMTGNTVRRWVQKFVGKIVESEESRNLTDIFHFDEQRVMIDGKEHWRYTIIDSNDNIICDRIEAKREASTIEKVMAEELGGREVSCIVTDMDSKYDAAIENLRRVIAKKQGKSLSQIKIRHQLCVFHQLMNVRKVIEDVYKCGVRKRMMEEGKMILKEITKVFGSKNRVEAWERLESLYQREDLPWKVRKEIAKIMKRFENLTWHLEDPTIPMTNNKVELYYRITIPEYVKRRYKSKKGLECVLKFYKLKHVRRNALFAAGLLCLNLWQSLGFIAQLIR